MKKVFISQPMTGKTDEEIRKTRMEMSEKVSEYFEGRVQIIDSYFDEKNPVSLLTEGMNSLGYLGMSLILLSKADAAVFAEDWENSKGCQLERKCCEEYGIEITEL